MTTIGFQGAPGAHSHLAAESLLNANSNFKGGIKALPFASYAQLFQELSTLSFAVVPMENSVSGSFHYIIDHVGIIFRHFDETESCCS